jgi:hypothetical protein
VVFLLLVFVVFLLVCVDVVVDDSSVVVLLLPPSPELLTIARNTMSTAISANGAKKRAGLLLLPAFMGAGCYGAHAGSRWLQARVQAVA